MPIQINQSLEKGDLGKENLLGYLSMPTTRAHVTGEPKMWTHSVAVVEYPEWSREFESRDPFRVKRNCFGLRSGTCSITWVVFILPMFYQTKNSHKSWSQRLWLCVCMKPFQDFYSMLSLECSVCASGWTCACMYRCIVYLKDLLSFIIIDILKGLTLWTSYWNILLLDRDNWEITTDLRVSQQYSLIY